MNEKNVLLIILDGYGHSEVTEHNAIALAKKPNIDGFEKHYPHCLIETSGRAVGLPDGVMGNSEVGHLNIGAGRVVKQEFTKIADFALENGFDSLEDVKRLMTSFTGNLHLLGLLSDGGVHSHIDHLFYLLRAAKKLGTKKKIYIHVITDGRDTPPQSALQFVESLEEVIRETGRGHIATVCGRFYVMDRDKRWERVKKAYDVFTGQEQPAPAASARQAVLDAYSRGETDEFISPVPIEGGVRIGPQDSMIFFNFRADRAREICRALAFADFKEFPTPIKIDSKNLATFTQYEEGFPFPTLFKPSRYQNLLGELVSAHGCTQLRAAETEKYAHVTYFFNGGVETQYQGEERLLVPSPKDVATYDLKPEMSARIVTQELLKKAQEKNYKLIVVNFANGDMVGHTGVELAAVKAIEVLDQCLGEVTKFFMAKDYDIFITADHGNSECMVDPKTGTPHTAHTTNPVPLYWLSNSNRGRKLKDHGVLADIAPTILSLFGWEQPKEMTGQNLILN